MTNYSQFVLIRRGSVQEGGNLVASFIMGTHRIEILAYTPAKYELPLPAREMSAISVVLQVVSSGVVTLRANLGVIETETTQPFFHFDKVNSIHVAWIEQAVRSQYLHNVPFIDWAVIAGDHFLGDDAIEIEDQWQYDQIDAQLDSEEDNDPTVVLFDVQVGSTFAEFIADLDIDESEEDDDTTKDEG